jgi:signal transduction histidine kinase/ActR/RegA family two-component response regulator
MGDDAAMRAAAPKGAASALSTILQTQSLRYWIIASWALGLWPVSGFWTALAWFCATTLAGAVRSRVEKRIAAHVAEGYGMMFPAVATAAGVFWAAAPVLAWVSGHPFGQALAVAYLASGYLLVFTQLRNSPEQALVISSPYTVVAAAFGIDLWGTPAFWAFAAIAPFVWSGLAVHVIVGMVQQARIADFQADQERLIHELEAARDKADAANRAKSAFLAVISHELRTPMNGVLGAAQLLDYTKLDATQKEYVGVIKNSGDGLLALLNDILDLTKIEAERMTLEAIEIDTRDLLDRIARTWRSRADEKDVGYAVAIPDEMPAAITGDPTRIGQVLHNLLSNAVKFTEQGEVRLAVTSERIGPWRARLTFAVSDTGPGISDADRERLFQPFEQLDASSTRRFGGTGLGLAISRRLCDLMGGSLEVASEPGRGSTFTFTVEVEVRAWSAPKVEEAVAATVEGVDAMRVLVVEDHPVNRMIIEAWLASSGHVTAAAENGARALDACRAEGFDLVLMDVNMPVMDGLEATRRLRAEPGPNRDVPVVMLSASARPEDHDAGYQAGADAYVTKPIDFALMAEVLARASEGRERLRAAA